jgi:hypothetical protein
MPRKKINDDMDGCILALLQVKYSQPQIVKILKQYGIGISQKTVSNVKRKIGRQRNSVEKNKFSRRRPVSTLSIISKVIQTSVANNRYKNFITTDESWFYLDGTEEKRKSSRRIYGMGWYLISWQDISTFC